MDIRSLGWNSLFTCWTFQIDTNHSSALMSLMFFDFSLLTGMEEKTFLFLHKLKRIGFEYSNADRFLRYVLQMHVNVLIWTPTKVGLIYKGTTCTDTCASCVWYKSRNQAASILFWISGPKCKDLIPRCKWSLFPFKSFFSTFFY